MSNPYWLSEEQMVRLRPYFAKSHGGPRGDDRRVLGGIIFMSLLDEDRERPIMLKNFLLRLQFFKKQKTVLQESECVMKNRLNLR